MRRGRYRIALLVAACCGLLASGCGGSAGGDTKSIVLYNGQHVQTAQALAAAFTKQTGISVSIRSNDEDTLADQIATEGSHSPADVFFTENSPSLENLQAKGLLARVDAGTLRNTPAKYNSPSGDWVGVSGRVSILIYNPALISAAQLPAQVRQLADPRYQGKLALAPQETDFQPIVTSYLHAYGLRVTLTWLKSIKKNASGHVYPDNETIASQVNRGAVAFGVVNQYYWYRMKSEIGAAQVHSKITHFMPGDPGYVIDVSGAGVVKSSPHQPEAQKFLAFLTSKQAQDIIASPSKSISYEYPIASGVTTQAPETPFDQLQPYPITIGQLGNGSTAISLMREAGLL